MLGEKEIKNAMETEAQLLVDITLLLVVAGALSVVMGRLRMPTIIGYMAAGLLFGSGLAPGMFSDTATIDLFSELGIILLMFFIGIELNLKGLRRLGPPAFLIVSIEMSMTLFIGYYLGRIVGLDPLQAMFLGAIMAGASTAAVLSVAGNNEHMQGDMSRRVMSIMIFEDIAQVVILTVVSPIAAGSGNAAEITVWAVLEIVAFMGLSIMIGLAVMPRAMNWLRDRYSKETLLIVALAFCFAMALLSSYIGLSVAIGAFLAGLILAESSCNNIVRRRIEPMKEVFMAIFFFAIGLQIDVHEMIQNIWLCILIAVVFVGAKSISVLVASYLTTLDLKSSFYISTSLVAMSEFGFIIAAIGLNAGLLDRGLYSTIIGAALITMIILPVLSRSGPLLFRKASENAPSWAVGLVRRMERIRMEVHRKLDISPEFRTEVRSMILLVFVNFVAIISFLILFNLLQPVRMLVAPLAEELQASPALVLFTMTLALIAPLVANIVNSLKAISMMIMINISEGGRHSVAGRLRIYHTFRDAGEIIVALILIFTFIPFLPPISDLSAAGFIGLVLEVIAVSAFSWLVIRPLLNRAASAFVARLSLGDEDEEVILGAVCEE
jgi:CPA2 family monovalent cation:H+ antiporter-2